MYKKNASKMTTKNVSKQEIDVHISHYEHRIFASESADTMCMVLRCFLDSYHSPVV